MFQGDVRLIIVAGSDTTSACMTFLFYELAKHPEEVKKLREELRPLTRARDWSDKDIKNAQHLNGAINESLRMYPPVPSGVQRVTPKEGMHVGEIYIPGRFSGVTSERLGTLADGSTQRQRQFLGAHVPHGPR